METMVISFPTQAQLDELFPVGPMEIDDQAKSEMGYLYDFVSFMARRMNASRNEAEDDLVFAEVWERCSPQGGGIDKREMAPHLAKLSDEDMHRFVEGAALHEIPLPVHVFDMLLTRTAMAISGGICTRMAQRRYPFIRFDISAYVAFTANIKDRLISIDHTKGERPKDKTA